MDSSATSLADSAHSSAFPYHLKALLDVPHRIFKPPKRPTVGRVRGFGLTSVYEVGLEDVLAGKHLPPLGLPEFEAYLLHTERSHENLQFILWFRDYEKQYRWWTRSSTYPQCSPELAHSYRRARQAFLTPSAPLELNLPAVTLAMLHTANPREHPQPEAFADAKHQVEGMLRASLNNFVRTMSANAGRNRGIFAIFIGVFFMCVGLAPILLSALGQRSRWLRFAALPCFWFGATTFICGLHGVCIVIYLFGDARQLTTYELARPTSSRKFLSRKRPKASKELPTLVDYVELSLPKPAMISDSHHFRPPGIGVPPNASELKYPFPPPKIEVFPPGDKFPYACSEPRSPSPSSPAVIAPFLLTPPGSPASTSVYDFDSIPPRASSGKHLKQSTPVFAPLTKALDQVAIRTYWETFVRSVLVALVVACILVAISVAVI